MTDRRRGLGRGLAALLGEGPLPVAGPHEVIRQIALAEIRPNPFQPRKHFNDETLDELKASIAEYGVLVPVIVRRREDAYELIAGERRWRACAALMHQTIPAVVRASNDRQTLELAIVENLQREDLNPLEEAAGLAHLIEEYGLTHDDIARRLGKSRPAVANALRLLGLSDSIKGMLLAGRLSAGHGRALLGAPPEMREALAQRAAREGLNVRQLERLAAAEQTKHRNTVRRPMAPSAEERDFEARLREKFATAVNLVRSARGGRIELRFANDAELMRLGDLLLGE